MARHVTTSPAPTASATWSPRTGVAGVTSYRGRVDLAVPVTVDLAVLLRVAKAAAGFERALADIQREFNYVEMYRKPGYLSRLIVPFPGRVTIYLVDEANMQITDEDGAAMVLAVV